MTNYELESVINQKMKDGVIPGAVVLVEKGGEGRWLRAFGTSTGDVPVKTDDYCRVGSNTKTMTATVILQLMQEGKLKLDDPVSKYYSGVPNGETLTIEQLLEMRSGLQLHTYDPSFVKQPQKVWKPEELLALSFAKPVNFGPGARNSSTRSANYIVLGLILEKLTGMSAPDAFQKRIFEPLGLKHTSLPALTDNKIPDPHAHGYMYLTDKSTLDNIALTPDQKAAAQAGPSSRATSPIGTRRRDGPRGLPSRPLKTWRCTRKSSSAAGSSTRRRSSSDSTASDRPTQANPKGAATDWAFRGLPPTSSVTTARSRGT